MKLGKEKESALAPTSGLNLNNAKDRDIRQIQLLESIEYLLKYVVRNTMPAYVKATRFKYSTYKLTKAGRVKDKDMNLLLNEDAEVVIEGVEDDAGNPAAIEGDKIDWSVSGDQDLGELQVAADLKSAKFIRNGKVGSCAIEFRADADLGPDVKEIVGSAALECLGGQATRFKFSATAVPKAV